MKRFDYYKSLNKRDQAIYRKSDGHLEIELPPHTPLAQVEELKKALLASQSRAINRACKNLSNLVCDALDVPRISFKIKKCRPVDEHSEAELYGYYEEIDAKAFITLYSKTAVHKRPVALKTFVRTLAHEICHHLDYHYLMLSDSFHTMGFYSRENQLSHWFIGEQKSIETRQLTLFLE